MFAGDDPIVAAAGELPRGIPGEERFVHAPFVLQDIADYRGTVQSWFAMLRTGGHLAIEVPNAFLCEREIALPSRRHPSRRRLYTPASLVAEIEEALEPNSYRIRLLCDRDDGYDYARDRDDPPVGEHGILLVVERIDPPAWSPDTGEVAPGSPPDFAFDPGMTRREIAVRPPRRRILILKLDHLGDFIMGLPALEQARRTFADADITLVVGTWNLAMAIDLGVADRVVAFDAFPRNATEDMVDLPARIGPFRETVTERYDLAIDLRTELDTRFLLQHVDADVRAGIGSRAQFDFLDIALPIEGTRHAFEAAFEGKFDHHGYSAAAACRRGPYSIAYEPRAAAVASPFVVWGPYAELQVGDYLYEPMIEVAGDGADLVLVDVAIDAEQVAGALASATHVPRLPFSIDRPGRRVEFRVIQPSTDADVGFRFYGGRLFKRGAESVLHQSEYLALLVHLIEMRVRRLGILREDVPA